MTLIQLLIVTNTTTITYIVRHLQKTCIPSYQVCSISTDLKFPAGRYVYWRLGVSSRLKIRSRELSTCPSSFNSNIITKKGEFLPLLVLNLGVFFLFLFSGMGTASREGCQIFKTIGMWRMQLKPWLMGLAWLNVHRVSLAAS